MASIINWVIDKYLNNILEINKDLTKTSLLTGEIQMANLKIKPEIFTLLNLPFFELVHGYVGKLRIKVKLPRIHLHPIKVEIENVFFHAKQKKLSNINKEGEIKFMEGFKNDSLQMLEEFKNELYNFKDELNANMLSKIINNIEINIKNISVRFDDEISYTLTPFCFGVIIKNMKFKTVDKEFKEVEGRYSIPFEEINNKIIKIEHFSVFLDTFENEGKLVEYNQKIVDSPNTEITDEKFQNFLGPMLDYYRYCLSETYEHISNYQAHNYILFNLGFVVKISINENMKNGKPKFVVSCNMNKIKIEISLVQIKTIMKLSIYQNLMLKYQSGLSREYYVKKLTEKEKMEYIENYINYYNFMYGKKKNEKKGNKIKAILSKVEEGLKYEEIQIMRNAAESKMSRLNEMENIDKKLKELKNEGKIFKRFSFKKKKNEEEEKEKEIEKKKQIEELEKKKAELEQIISDLVKNRLEHIELLSGLFPDASDNFSLLTIDLEIPEIKLVVSRHKEEKLFSLILDKLNAFGDLKNREQYIKMTINDMSLIQYQLPDSQYQMIMTTVEQKNENFSEEEKEEINACDIELFNNPEFEKTNYKIKFRNQKRIIVIINIFSLQYISKKFSDYMTFFMDNNFDFPEKYNCSGEIYKFIKDGFKYDSLETGLHHFNADLDVSIKSPILLFPIDILDNLNKKFILIRCGDFHISSILPQREDKNIKYDEVKEREKLIDTYILKSEKLCVTTLDDFNGDLSLLLDAQGLNLIEDVSFDLYADIKFADNNKLFEKFKVGMNIGKCRVNVRDKQLPFFMELYEKSGKLLKLALYKLEDKTYFEKKEIKFNKEEEDTYNINNKKIKEDNNNNGIKNIEVKNEEKEKNNEKENNNEKEKLNVNNLEVEAKDIKEIEKNEEKSYNKEEDNENKENKNEKENNNEVINKEENKKNDYKLLTFNFHLEDFQLCLQKTISYGEKQILLRKDYEKYIDLIYRDFIIFDMNNFKIELFLSEKMNINATLLIKSIGIIDKETLITNENNPKGDLYIDKEFQDIIKMDSGKDEKNKSSSCIINSENNREDSISIIDIDNYDKENDKENNKENYDEFFMIIYFKYNNELETQTADISLKKIRICIAMSTFTRILQFSFYYLEMFNKIVEKNLIIWEKMEMEHRKEKMKNKIIRRNSKKNLISTSPDKKLSDDEDSSNSDEEEEIENNELNKISDNKLSLQLTEDNNKSEKDLFTIDTSSKNNEAKEKAINIFNKTSSNSLKSHEDIEKEAEETLKNKEIKLNKILRNKNIKINTKIKFEMKEACILFPLEDTKSVTNVVRIKSNINGSVSFRTDFVLVRNGNDKLVKININENIIKAGLKIPNVEFDILNYQNGIYTIEDKCDKILAGFRLCLNIDSLLLLPKKEQTVTIANIGIEPLVFNIGITQIESFINFMPVLNDLFIEVKKEYDDPIKEFEDYQDIDLDIYNNIYNNLKEKEDFNIISTSSKNEIEDEQNEKTKEKKKIMKYMIKKRKKRKKKGNEETKKNLEEKVEINLVKFNNTIDVAINIEKILFKIINNSGYYLQPLINIEFRLPPIHFIINTNSDSVTNINNLLMESISRKEIPINQYEIQNLTIYGKIGFSFSVLFYNNRIDDWEPLIEKYSAYIILDQIAWFSRLRITYYSNDMLNLNISFSILFLINDILKIFLEKNKKVRKLSDLESDTDDGIAIEFINYTGIEISCWLDAEDNLDWTKNYIFHLNNKSNNRKKINRSKLNKIYQKLTEAQLKIKKDKFSFKVQGYLPITSNDFSSNYNTCYKLKKDQNNINNENLIDNKNDIKITEEKNSLLLEELLLPQNEEDNIIDTSSKEKKSNILINEDNEEEDIEIFIKIRKNGNLRSIIFESNIFFYNNLEIPISLSLISQKDFIYKYNSNDNIIEHENSDKLIINSGRRKSLALIYLIKKYRIYISFHDNSNKKKYNYSLLYENFNDLKNNYKNFIQYEKENIPTYKGKKEIKLNDYYSKLIFINHKNKNFYLCSNLIVQHSTNDIIKDTQNEQINIRNKKENNNNNINIKNEEEEESTINKNLMTDICYSKAFSY